MLQEKGNWKSFRALYDAENCFLLSNLHLKSSKKKKKPCKGLQKDSNYHFDLTGVWRRVTLFCFVDVLQNCELMGSLNPVNQWYGFGQWCSPVDVILDCTINGYNEVRLNATKKAIAQTHVCWVTKEGAADGRGCGGIHISSTVVRSFDSTRPGVDWQRPIAT